MSTFVLVLMWREVSGFVSYIIDECQQLCWRCCGVGSIVVAGIVQSEVNCRVLHNVNELLRLSG